MRVRDGRTNTTNQFINVVHLLLDTVALRVADEDPQPFTEGIAHELSNDLRELSAQHGWLSTACLMESLPTPNLAKGAAVDGALQSYGKDPDQFLPSARSGVNALQVAPPIRRVLLDSSREAHAKDRNDRRNPSVRKLIGQRNLARQGPRRVRVRLPRLRACVHLDCPTHQTRVRNASEVVQQPSGDLSALVIVRVPDDVDLKDRRQHSTIVRLGVIPHP